MDVKTHTAAQLHMTTGDKRQLIDQIADALDIGGWVCGEGNFDVTDEDIEREWSELEAAMETWSDVCAYRIALLLATKWERECATAG